MADTLDLDPEWGAIDLIEDLEAIFDFKITDEEAQCCCTVGDLYEILCAHSGDWDEQVGNCGSSIVFYRLRCALGPTDKHTIRPSTHLGSVGLTPSALLDRLEKHSGMRLPTHSLARLGVVGSWLLFAGVIGSIVAFFNAHWAISSGLAVIALVGLGLVWRDPGRFPKSVETFGDLVNRTVPLNSARLKELGGKPADRWSILTATASEYGLLPPDAISSGTFLHRKSLEQASVP